MYSIYVFEVNHYDGKFQAYQLNTFTYTINYTILISFLSWVVTISITITCELMVILQGSPETVAIYSRLQTYLVYFTQFLANSFN